MISSLFLILFKINSSALSEEPTSFSICATASFAPPCNGPFKLATAPVTAPCISDKLLVITLEVNVDALKLCSAYNVMDASNALTTSLLGTFPKHI